MTIFIIYGMWKDVISYIAIIIVVVVIWTTENATSNHSVDVIVLPFIIINEQNSNII